jgi:hypothetical protein
MRSAYIGWAAPLVALCLVAAPAGACDRVASPNGSDDAPGNEEAPFRTAQRLADSLGPGLTGCLRQGVYEQDVKMARGGTPAARAVLRAYPGERAALVGRLWIASGADNVTVAALELDGRNARGLPSPTVNGNGAVFAGNDVTNGHTAICFNVGHPSYGRAGAGFVIDGTTISGNRIHDCGRLPPTNYDHGVYVVHATGTEIAENVIYDNADRGIQLYPDAQRTTVRRNVIDGNGEGLLFAGAGGIASNDTLVEGNVISNSRVRYNVESYYEPGTPPGERNVVTGNCLFGSSRNPAGGGVQENQVGFVAAGNVVADPAFVDRENGDFRLGPDSGCRAVFPDIPAAAPPPQRPAPAEAADRTAPELSVSARTQRPQRVVRRGLRILLHCSEPCRARIEARAPAALARRLGLRPRAGGLVLGRASVETERSGRVALRIPVVRRARPGLSRLGKARLRLTVTGDDHAGNRAPAVTTRVALRR